MTFKAFYESTTKQYQALSIPVGTKLYHGTVEQFEKEKLLPGGYDDVLWTAENPNVARSYIPAAGSRVMLKSSSIVKPSQDDTIQNIQKKFGIEYDYEQVEFQPNGRPQSYFPAPVFREIEERERSLSKKMIELKKKMDEFKEKADNDEYIDTLSDEEVNKFFKSYSDVEEEYIKIKEKFYEYKADDLKNEYVNKKIKEYGYEPENNFGNNDYGWNLKIKNRNIAPESFKEKGRLFTITPKRELKIYDLTMGETIEPDLMDKQYHEIGLFRKAEEAGFDGIKISDFAQNEHWGNVGHYSIGLFKGAIKDFEIDEIEATHPDPDEY